MLIVDIYAGNRKGYVKNEIGLIFVNRSRSNILLTLTDINGQIKKSMNAGLAEYSGRAKRSTWLYTIFSQKLVLEAKRSGYKYVIIVVKIPVRKYIYNMTKVLESGGIRILGLSSTYVSAHNGCRFRKPRR